MAEKLIFEKFSNLSWLQKNLNIRQSKEFLKIVFIAISSVIIYDHSLIFSFSLDIPVSSYGRESFKKLLWKVASQGLMAQLWFISWDVLIFGPTLENGDNNEDKSKIYGTVKIRHMWKLKLQDLAMARVENAQPGKY